MAAIAYAPSPSRSVAPRLSSPRVASVGVAPVRVAPVRLTRRGRLLATVLLFVVLGMASVAFGASSAATDVRGVATPTQTYVVDQGDTLWDIADSVAGPGEIPHVMSTIEAWNHLDGAGLVDGQTLVIPLP